MSEKHCGFVVNKDQATAADVMNLMNQVSDKVYEMSGGTAGAGSKETGSVLR